MLKNTTANPCGERSEIMEQPTVLRTTKIGGGFVKEDVLQYLDELNSKIESLEKELEESSGPKQPAADPQEIAKYRTQIDNLQEKLNAANNGWRAARKENDELKKQLDQIKAGKGIPTDSGNQAALDAAKKEVAALKAQLAQQKSTGGQAQPQNNAALDAAKKEIDRLKAQLQQKPGVADNSAVNAELTKVKQDLSRAVAELKSKTEQLAVKTKESADKDSKIAKLTKDVESASGKDAEISKLKGEISQLNEKMSNPTALLNDLMSNILNNAQESAEKSKKEAEESAASKIKEAQEKADKIIKDADDKANKTISNANNTAKKTVDDANATAKKTVDNANAEAEKAVKDANEQAKKLNDMSSTVRTLLLNEIESVNSKFTNLTDAVNKLVSQTTEKLKETNDIISEARKAVETGKDSNIKLAEVNKADFKPADTPKSAVPPTPAKSVAPAMSGMDDIVINKPPVAPAKSAVNTATQKPSVPPVHETPKPAAPPKKPVNNFGFDMADLLKAAEEEAAKNAE